MVKGMTINILSAGLIIVAAVIIYSVFNPTSYPHLEEYTKTDIYTMKNAIDSSRIYLETAVDYSVYQAVYDIAKNGGFGNDSGNDWTGFLEEGEFITNTKNEILTNINAYTGKGYRFIDFPSVVGLPKYDVKDFELEKSGQGVRISLSGSNIKLSKRGEEEVISLEASSSIENLYDIDLFGLYSQARISYNKVGTGCDVLTEGDEITTTEAGFRITQNVLSKTGSGLTCIANVKVSITSENPKQYHVMDGKASLKPITFEFIAQVSSGQTLIKKSSK